jgi:hypothetical protein
VPGSGFPFLLSIRRPMPNAAMPELFPEHGRNTLNTAHKQQIILDYFFTINTQNFLRATCIFITVFNLLPIIVSSIQEHTEA